MADYETVRDLARQAVTQLYAGQADGSPAGPRGEEALALEVVSALDSFSLLEVVLMIEEVLGVPILEKLADFPGGPVDDLVAFAFALAARQVPGAAETPGGSAAS